MDHDQLLKRLEAARTHAALQRLEAVEMLARNVDLRHENGEAFAREHARKHREARQIEVEPDGTQRPDAES